VLENDFARGHGKVAADLESIKVCLAYLKEIARSLHILGQMGEALNEIAAVRGKSFAQDLRVRNGKVLRRECTELLLGVELGFHTYVLVVDYRIFVDEF